MSHPEYRMTHSIFFQTRISDLLGLSEEVAGVTLVALGNGAPDIFAGMVLCAISCDQLLLLLKT